MKNINVFHYQDSLSSEKLKMAIKKIANYKFKFLSYEEIEKNKFKSTDIIIFEEEDSYISCSSIFEKLISRTKALPVVVVIISNREIINIVGWMRKGVADCLWIGDINENILLNSINDAVEFFKSKKEVIKNIKKSEKIKAERKEIDIPKNSAWSVLENDKYYDMSLILIHISIHKNAIGRYSAEAIERIYESIKIESENTARYFGGRNWFWNNNFGVQIFHFGDRIDCAVLSGITFYLHFFLLCVEKLKLKEMINIKIAIHDGNGIYHATKTDQITSDIINSLTHLVFKYTKSEYLNITKDVYKKLSDNLKKHFSKIGKFENRDIYNYNFYNNKH